MDPGKELARREASGRNRKNQNQRRKSSTLHLRFGGGFNHDQSK